MDERQEFVKKLIDLVEAYNSETVPVSLYAKDKKGCRTLKLTKENYKEMRFPLVIYPFE